MKLIANQRVEIATSRTMTAQERADASMDAAERARDDANTARIYSAQFDPSFKQPGIELMRRQRTGTPSGMFVTRPHLVLVVPTHFYLFPALPGPPFHPSSPPFPTMFMPIMFPSTRMPRPISSTPPPIMPSSSSKGGHPAAVVDGINGNSMHSPFRAQVPAPRAADLTIGRPAAVVPIRLPNTRRTVALGRQRARVRPIPIITITRIILISSQLANNRPKGI